MIRAVLLAAAFIAAVIVLCLVITYGLLVASALP